MSLLTSSIDLDTITPPAISSSQFPAYKVENLANLFLKAGDTVSPILVRKVSPIAFEVLEGHFEYYAAIKAQEIDEQFTAIRAYVVPPDLEATILEQYQFLRSLSSPAPVENIAPPNKSDDRELDLAKVEQAIAERLEKKLATTIDRIVEERISSSFQAFATQMTQQLDTHLLDFRRSLLLTNNKNTEPPIQSIQPIQPIDLPTESVSKRTSKTEKPAKTKAKTERSTTSKNKDIEENNPKSLQVLNDLNTMNVADLERKLSQLKPSKRNLAKPIHAQRLQQPDQKFQSISDLMNKVDVIKKPTMQKIIGAW
jgi:hypothetical protein